MSKQFTLPNNPLGWQANPHDFTGDNMLGIYTQETTQRYVYGTRFITWDGRVFKYAKAGSTMSSMKYAVYGYNQLVAERTSPSATVNAAVAGDKTLNLTVTAGTVGVSRNGIIAEDALAGGFISMYQSSSDRSQRMIVGNDALAAAGTNLCIYLEAPVMATVTAGTGTEVLANPYSDVRSDTEQYGIWSSALGMPCVVATSTYNYWIQTYGICRITPTGAAFGANQGERQMVVAANGSVCSLPTWHTQIATTPTHSYQVIGSIMERTSGTSEDAAPFVMLTFSI